MKKKILVFSGAGISKESGIDTFRDSGGLWNNYDVMKVAHIDDWKNDPQTVIDFYNFRRKDMGSVNPNKAHKILAELEKYFDVTIATQNVDPLHEMAGSTNVIHLHGEITKLRSEKDPNLVIEWKEELKLGQLSDDGGQLRPDIVWFGEELNYDRVNKAMDAAKNADICIIIGTSMQVAPANQIPLLIPETALIYYVDPGDKDFYLPKMREFFFYHIQKSATEGMQELKKDLFSTFKIKKNA